MPGLDGGRRPRRESGLCRLDGQMNITVVRIGDQRIYLARRWIKIVQVFARSGPNKFTADIVGYSLHLLHPSVLTQSFPNLFERKSFNGATAAGDGCGFEQGI